MRNYHLSAICACVCAALLISRVACAAPGDDLTRYVNPRQGTNSTREFSTGNTYPAVAVPWGMNFWVAQTGKMGDGWQYTWDAPTICGFKQTHQPSPWINDFGCFSIMPVSGDPKAKFSEQARASKFTHAGEISLPHYYAVNLDTYNIRAEMTPTMRGAIMRFIYTNHENAAASIIIDCFDKGGYIKVIPSENKIVGYSRYYARSSGKKLPENFATYFVITADHPIAAFGTWNDPAPADPKPASPKRPGSKRAANAIPAADDADGTGKPSSAPEQKGGHVGAYVTFANNAVSAAITPVTVKVASSFISLAQAQLNYDREVAALDFDAAKTAAAAEWNNRLRRTAINDPGATGEQLRTFYTALYHMMLFPHALHEIDAAGATVHYSPFDGAVHPGPFYTGNGFWDTFRAVHPYFTIMYPGLVTDNMRGLVNYYHEGGWLPEWASPGYLNSMIGQNSAAVIADACLKNLVPADAAPELWKALVKSANNAGPASAGREGVEYYNKLGYLPYDAKIKGSVSRTLEYAYDDWCIWRMGVALGRPASETDPHRRRAGNWRNLFDPETKFMRPKNAAGQWQPLSPAEWQPDYWTLPSYTEGSSWHWTWSVMHDPQGLANAMGGDAAFIAKLDSVFAAPPTFDPPALRKTIHEMTEMVAGNTGQYAHGNEPVHHMLYLYAYAGAPWKTQQHVREILTKLYHSGWLDGKGLCGDEDNGQMSAWYVFSALGFYPVCPGANEYIIGSPLFAEATLTLPNNNQFTIRAKNNTPENIYIQSATLNGAPLNRAYLRHEEILAGGLLEFQMGPTPNKTWATAPAARPYSMSKPE